MSLNIYFDGVGVQPNSIVQMDAEAFFSKVHMDGCDYDRLMLANIECGSFVDDLTFRDRFNRILFRKFLSTGTKVALILYHLPDSVVNGAEVGYNALTEIVKHCDRGSLFLPADNYHISCDMSDSAVDVICHGRHFKSLFELSEYMMEEAPYA